MTATTFPFEINHEGLDGLATDLNIDPPRGPREKIADYVFAARTLDKGRAYLAGTLGDYEFNCKLDRRFFDFTTINVLDFMQFVATGADDSEMDRWIREYAIQRERSEIVKWNNQMRELRISDLPVESQLYLEDYIPQIQPPDKSIVTLFDVFDVEEGRL